MNSLRFSLPLAFAFMLTALTGCNSYRIVQSSRFANDEGKILCVDYGRAERDHVTTAISPINGAELDFKSKLVVEVEVPPLPKFGLPDGDSFTAWQGMNFIPNSSGTLYQSDDREWYFLASGFTCAIYRQDRQNPAKYLEVYSGVLCNTPSARPKQDDDWHKVRNTTYRPKKAQP